MLIGILLVSGSTFLLWYLIRTDYQKSVDEHNSKTTEKALELEIQKEKTRQLKMKTDYMEKYGSTLYSS